MVGKGNLVVFESSNISETIMATPIKIGVHAQYIDLYFHDSQMLSVLHESPTELIGCLVFCYSSPSFFHPQ